MGHHWDFGDTALIIFAVTGCILVWSWLSREASLTASLMDAGKKKQAIPPASRRKKTFASSRSMRCGTNAKISTMPSGRAVSRGTKM